MTRWRSPGGFLLGALADAVAFGTYGTGNLILLRFRRVQERSGDLPPGVTLVQMTAAPDLAPLADAPAHYPRH